jgi:PIN domain nuclease of toxin-antitoxin system
MTVILDTHVLVWLSAAPRELSPAALRTINGADELAVAAITWWEIAWLTSHGRLTPSVPARAWVVDMARSVRTLPLTPAIAQTAADLPAPFPRDPVDRLIYATAVEHGYRLVTKDGLLHEHDPGGTVVIW